MSYRDLRGWIDAVEAFGELKRINGADWNLELGAITEVFARRVTGCWSACITNRCASNA